MTFHRLLSLSLVIGAGGAKGPAGGGPGARGTLLLPHPVATDSIYSLAVDSNAYREYAFVYLLDEGVVRVETDGRGTRTYRQVIQILKPAGVARWAEQSISYQPDREKVTVNWMRVVRPSGEVIADKPVQSQTSDVPASIVNPVYTTTKVVRYSLSNVAPGTLVDLSWTIETTNPPLAGDMLTSWSVSLVSPGMRSHFVLDVPDAMIPRIVETHLDFKRSEVHRGGRHLFTWARRDVRPPRGELFAPDSSVPAMSVRTGAPLTWAAIGRWYNDLAKDRYTLSPVLSAVVDSVVRSAKSTDDTLEALHQWIATDLRYVSVSLGIGGYQPRFPEATVGTGYGDCKDKTTLFIAAAHHVGMIAYPVLLNIFGGTDRALPAIEQFNHVIAAVLRPGRDDFTYLDLTTDAYSHGDIPPTYQGGFGLVVLADGSTREITFPKDAAGASEQSFVGELGTDGKVSGTLTVTAHGSSARGLRAALSEPMDSARWANLKRSAPKPFPGATLDTVILSDFKDRLVPPSIRFVLAAGEAAKPAGSLSILTIPAGFRGIGPNYSRAIEELQRAPKRELPIDAARILAPGTSRTELRLTLPPGWTAQLPDSVNATSDFGTYRVEYGQTGRVLKVVHTVIGGTAVLPPTRIDALFSWLHLIGTDDTQFIPLTHGN